jgi:hypothetical protein
MLVSLSLYCVRLNVVSGELFLLSLGYIVSMLECLPYASSVSRIVEMSLCLEACTSELRLYVRHAKAFNSVQPCENTRY